MVLGAAGAPLELFGPEDAPSFVGAFQELQRIGFNSFFPWFATREVDGVAEISGHFDFWLPPSIAPGAHNCSVINPYYAASGRLGVIFPAMLFADYDGDEVLDASIFTARYEVFRDECWGGTEEPIAAFESFDETALRFTVNQFLGTPGPRLSNVPAVATLLHELSTVPVMGIEGALPLVVQLDGSLTPTQKQEIIDVFWDAVAEVVVGQDIFGFDVYPVPDIPLGTSGEYVRLAQLHAPDTARIAVLQAFSRQAESGGASPGRGPTLEESRWMAFDAVISGARHLIWYGANVLDPYSGGNDAEVWEGVSQVVGLMRRLAPSLERPEVSVVSTDPLAATGRRLDGGLLLLVVNRGDVTVDGSLELDRSYDAVVNWESGEQISHTGGSVLSLSLAPLESLVLLAYSCSG